LIAIRALRGPAARLFGEYPAAMRRVADMPGARERMTDFLPDKDSRDRGEAAMGAQPAELSAGGL
jgi:hypothetical protein